MPRRTERLLLPESERFRTRPTPHGPSSVAAFSLSPALVAVPGPALSGMTYGTAPSAPLPATGFRAAFATLALVLAFSGQAVLTGDAFTRGLDTLPDTVSTESGWRAFFLFALAALAGGLSARLGRSTRASSSPASFEEPVVAGGENLIDVARRCVPAAAAWAAGVTLMLLHRETGWVRLAWAVSMTLLMLAFRRDFRRKTSDLVPWERLALGAIVLGGLVARVFDLGDLPAHVDNDISWMALETQRLIDTGNARWFGLAGTDHLLAWHQVIALGMKVFGSDFRGILYPSAVLGALTIPFVYLLGRDLVSRAGGLVAATLFAFSYTHIHFSRTMFGPKPGFLLTAAFALLVRGLQGGGLLAFAAGGMALGLGVLTYDSGKIGPVLLVAMGLLGWLANRQLFRRHTGGLLVFVLGSAVAFGPMLGLALKDFNVFVGRGDDVAIYSPSVLKHCKDKYRTEDVGEIVFQQTIRSFGTLHLYGDESPHFNLQRPMISALAAALLVVGVGVSLAGWRRPLLLLPLLWMTLTFLLGGVLPKDPPYWPHFNIAIPATALLGALGATEVVSALAGYARFLGRLCGVALAVALGVNAWHSWALYERFGSRNQDARITLARYLRLLDPQTEVLVSHAEIRWGDFVFLHWFPGRAGANLVRDEILAVPRDDGRPRIFVVQDRATAVELKNRHPVSTTRAHMDAWRDILLWTVAVQPERPRAARVRPPERPGILLVLVGAVGVGLWSLKDFLAWLARAFVREAG